MIFTVSLEWARQVDIGATANTACIDAHTTADVTSGHAASLWPYRLANMLLCQFEGFKQALACVGSDET